MVRNDTYGREIRGACVPPVLYPQGEAKGLVPAWCPRGHLHVLRLRKQPDRHEWRSCICQQRVTFGALRSVMLAGVFYLAWRKKSMLFESGKACFLNHGKSMLSESENLSCPDPVAQALAHVWDLDVRIDPDVLALIGPEHRAALTALNPDVLPAPSTELRVQALKDEAHGTQSA